jgi:capsular exopolysaccharide synthesis family protein
MTDGQEVHLTNYLRVVRKHLWLIAAIFLVIVTAAVILSFKMVPVYKATAQVLVESSTPRAAPFKEVYTADTQQEFYTTQHKLLKSRRIAEKTVAKLNLVERGEFPTEKAAASYVQRAILVEPIRGSRLVSVSVEGSNPEKITQMVNTVVDAFVEYNREERQSTSFEALGQLTAEVLNLKDELDNKERALAEFQEKNKLLFLEKGQEIEVVHLAHLSNEFQRTQSHRIALEAPCLAFQEAQTNGEALEHLPAIAENTAFQSLMGQHTKLEQEWSALSSTYKDNHPRMLALKARIETMRSKIEEAKRRAFENLKTKYEIARLEEEERKKLLELQRKVVTELNNKLVGLRALSAERDNTHNIYEALVQRVKEIDVTAGFPVTNIRVVDYAQMPKMPIKPRKARNIVLASIMALVLGVGLSFFLEYLDNSVKNMEDVKDYLKIPVLGLVPYIDGGVDGGVDGRGNKYLISHLQRRSGASEAFRTVRTGIFFSAPEKELKRILVTSSIPGEGKTMLATNTAITMAQSGYKTLLVDADMRHPELHKSLQVIASRGLSNVLVGDAEPQEVISPTQIENLDLLPCGPIPPNPAELLGSQMLKTFLGKVEQKYDKIVFDSPPVISVTDPLVLATFVDGVLMVIQAGKCAKPLVLRSKEQLEAVKARIVGAVLNDVTSEVGRYYYRDYYYYRYYSGYYGEKTKPEAVPEEAGRSA